MTAADENAQSDGLSPKGADVGEVSRTEATEPVTQPPVESVPVESAPVEPASVESAPVEPVPVESAPVESAPAEPASVESVPVEPASVESASVESVPSEPASVEPASVESVPAEPASVEPASVESVPVEPAPAESAKKEDGSTAAKPQKKPPVKVLEGIVTAVSSDEVSVQLPDGRSAVIYRRNFGLQDEDPTTVLSVGDGAFGAELARDDPKGRVVLSRSWVLKKQKWEKLEASAAESKFVTGKVLSVNKNGLVVDVGVRGFVPASHIELQPVDNLQDYIGTEVEAKIIEINPSSERLVLSRRPILLRKQRQKVKELLSSLNPGDIKKGAVVSLADYGAFVDLGGIKGLVHVSEMAWERVGKPSDVLTVGDEVEVKVLEINVKKRRIGLSIRQLKDDPLSVVEVDSIITGRVTRLVDFGAFVDIGAIEGLVHLSELAEYRVQAPEEIVAPGDQIRVKVLSVDPKRRRVALSVRQAAEFGG